MKAKVFATVIVIMSIKRETEEKQGSECSFLSSGVGIDCKKCTLTPVSPQERVERAERMQQSRSSPSGYLGERRERAGLSQVVLGTEVDGTAVVLTLDRVVLLGCPVEESEHRVVQVEPL